MNEDAKPKISPLLRTGLNLGPLILFFVTFERFGIYAATSTFVAATLIVLAVHYAVEKKLAPVPLFTAILVVIFGGLTIYLKNDIFIKMKLTVLYTFFSVVLLGGLYTNRLFIKYVFSEAFELTESGWRQLTLRWGLFMLALAAVNEIIWRNFSTDIWVKFKVFGVTGLFLVFALAQTPFLLKHQIEEKKSGN
jgi:intracellular septation protein